MDTLPVEVLAIIFKHLREWNVLDRPFSYLTETSPYYGGQHDGWLVHTAASREDICNFRLMGRKYRSSSPCAFGGILCDRKFRLTRVGLDDLQALSSVAVLRPYIHAITFGSAQFVDPAKMENLWELLPEPDRIRIRAAYTTEFEWQMSNAHNELHQRFESILDSLPKLRSLRLDPFDDPRDHPPLGGWLLTVDDYELIQERWDGLANRLEEKYHTYTKDLTVFAPMFSAITSTRKEISDFRLAPLWSVEAPCFYTALKDTSMVSHLRSVRLDLEWRWAVQHSDQKGDQLPKAFGHFVDVTHLTINVWVHTLSSGNFAREKSLLTMLSSVKQFKQLIIKGHCHFRENELVEFVARHSQTLEIFALKLPVMSGAYGSWTSTARQILQMPLPALQYLELFEMRQCIERHAHPLAFADATEWGEFFSAIDDIAHVNNRLTLLSQLEIGTVQYVSNTLRPPPTKKLCSQQPPSLPEHVPRRQ